MGYFDHIDDPVESTIVCPNCGKKYSQWLEEQVPGCRSKDYDVCPYCNSENGSSMSYEYHNQKIE